MKKLLIATLMATLTIIFGSAYAKTSKKPHIEHKKHEKNSDFHEKKEAVKAEKHEETENDDDKDFESNSEDDY